MPNIKEFLNSDDPLTRDVAAFLISYSEEDDQVDYKQSFDPTSEKDWLEITKDISAFANTLGGYLVFGISDVDKEIFGLTHKIAKTLKDINNLQQKINRNLEPDISLLRSKEFRFNGKSIVVLHIPQSVGITHLISKDGSFVYPTGAEKTVLRKGTFHIRRSAGNHLGDSRDLDALIERRIDQFRDALIDKVVRVVESPINSNVFILSRDPTTKEGERFIIEDSPDSIAIKGMSFTIPPKGTEEEIAAYSVLYRGDSEARPPDTYLWRWYSEREKIQIRDEHKLTIFRFSLWDGAPAFYWIKDLKSQVIRDTLLDTIRNRPTGLQVNEMLIVAALLGKGTYNRALSVLGDYKDRINPRMKHYPKNGLRSEFVTLEKPSNQSLKQFNKEKLKKLNDIAKSAAESGNAPDIYDQWEAIEIDRYLYTSDKKYK